MCNIFLFLTTVEIRTDFHITIVYNQSLIHHYSIRFDICSSMAFTEILFLLCATIISGTEGTVELSNYIQNHSHTLCPFTNYCSKKSSEVFKNETIIPCCSDCSCEASTCYQTENCCPDIEPIPDKSTDLVCSDTMTKFNQWSAIKFHNGYKDGIKRYFVTATCPDKYEDEFVVSKCNGDNSTELGDFLWVSHSDNDIIYQNYYCAICHGVEHWITWNFWTNCFVQLIETGFQNLSTTLLSDGCTIVNDVPEMKVDVSRRYQCYMPDFTSCNTTGIVHEYYAYAALHRNITHMLHYTAFKGCTNTILCCIACWPVGESLMKFDRYITLELDSY